MEKTPAQAQEKIQLPKWHMLIMEAHEGSAEERQRKLEEALSLARESQQKDHYPESECLFELGVAQAKEGKTKEAEKFFAQAVPLKTEDLKIVLTGSGYVPGNLPAYSSPTQEHDGKTHDLANCLGWLGRMQLAQQKYEDAERSFDQAIKLLDTSPETSKDPQHECILLPDVLINAAKVKRQLKHAEQAQKLEDRAHFILSHRELQ